MIDFIGGIFAGMFIMCIIVARLENYWNKTHYYIKYNDITDEYELIDYCKDKWDNRVVFKASTKEIVEARYKWIMERQEGTPVKLSKKFKK